MYVTDASGVFVDTVHTRLLGATRSAHSAALFPLCSLSVFRSRVGSRVHSGTMITSPRLFVTLIHYRTLLMLSAIALNETCLWDDKDANAQCYLWAQQGYAFYCAIYICFGTDIYFFAHDSKKQNFSNVH